MNHELIFWTTASNAGQTTEPDLVPQGATITDQAGYDAYVASHQSAIDAIAADQAAAAQAVAHTDYTALVAAGVPDATARNLTGYKGAP